MSTRYSAGAPWVFWPVDFAWDVATGVLQLLGRAVAVLLGLLLIGIGGIFCMTIVGAVLGVPAIALGALLVARGFF